MDARHAGVADFLAPEGYLARHGGYAAGGALGDALDGLGDFAGPIGRVVGALFLDVEVFGVFAHDD